MSKFFLNSKINSLLKNTGKPPIVEINFLGTGGAFDLLEKNSSVVIKTSSGTILIDCGFTVYPELLAKGLVEKIDYIFITHCHEDHIGSLSTFVYHKYFGQKQTAKIECSDSLKPMIENYLLNVCGHMADSFVVNSNEGTLYKELNMIIHKIETTGYHYKDFPTSGYVFNLKKSGENVFLIYSGDINVPIVDIINEVNKPLYDSLLEHPSNVFIFHESTARDYPPYFPHCEYKKLEKTAELFPNIYTYHHSKKESEDMQNDIKTVRAKLDMIKKTIDLELNSKLSRINKYETKERLRIQAKRFKEEITEDLNINTLKAQDLNVIGKDLFIHEEMGL